MTLTKDQKDILSSMMLTGDVSNLNNEQRVLLVQNICSRVGIDWTTQPFRILKETDRKTGKVKESLYATKDCTEQLRKVHVVSIINLEKSFEMGLCTITAYAEDKTGKKDVSTGSVPIELPSYTGPYNDRVLVRDESGNPKMTRLMGEALSNAIMKAETKAKRRVTLSICGLGMLDESETESIPGTETKALNEPANTTVDTTHTEVKKEEKQPEPPKQQEPEKSVDDLHKEFMVLYHEYTDIVGSKISAVYHPDNWKNERTVKAYIASIPAMKKKVEDAKAQKEFALNGK